MKSLVHKTSFLTLVFCLLFSVSYAQDDAPKFEDGLVWHLEFIRTVDGHGDGYRDYLAANYVSILKMAKEKGIIEDYKIIGSMPGNEDDWDVLLMTAYTNFAALDNVEDKFEAMMAEMMKNDKNADERKKAVASRFEMRQILGSKMGREMTLK